jgi:hypothetical protein
MHPLAYQLTQLAMQHRTGSFQTHHARVTMLQKIARDLETLGYRQLRAHQLKGRHVEALVARWQADEMAAGTLKNYMATLRWVYRALGKQGSLAKANAAYGIPERVYIPTTSKAQTVDEAQITAVPCPYLQMSLRLQQAFGLRREESLKIRPWQADQGTWLVLQASWCKGGRARTIPIRTAAQREVLEAAKTLVRWKHASLIPPERTYIAQLNRYKAQTRQAGLRKLHGLRHAYASERYEEITGMPTPLNRGDAPARRELQDTERDQTGRLIVSAELGHQRPAITTTYIGSTRTAPTSG